MHGPPRGYQQWNTGHAVMQPYTATPLRNDPHENPTLSQDNTLYETSREYEHARPVSSNNIVTSPCLHRGYTSSSAKLSLTSRTSLPRPQGGANVLNPTFQPTQGTQELRMTTSDFVPGVSEHNF